MGNFQQAFTLRSESGVFRELITQIGVSVPLPKDEEVKLDDGRIHHTLALWDTGATGSVITKTTAANLGLKPSGLAKVNHAGGCEYANTYIVDIFLPNRICFSAMKVTECPDVVGKFGVIIGMDIISKGDFSFTNNKGNSIFSFKIPSNKETDFVAEIEEAQKYQKIHELWMKKGNDKCPCCSGKKYKNCHGK